MGMSWKWGVFGRLSFHAKPIQILVLTFECLISLIAPTTQNYKRIYFIRYSFPWLFMPLSLISHRFVFVGHYSTRASWSMRRAHSSIVLLDLKLWELDILDCYYVDNTAT